MFLVTTDLTSLSMSLLENKYFYTLLVTVQVDKPLWKVIDMIYQNYKCRDLHLTLGRFIQGAVAARAQEGLEELSHTEGQEGRW